MIRTMGMRKNAEGASVRVPASVKTKIAANRAWLAQA